MQRIIWPHLKKRRSRYARTKMYLEKSTTATVGVEDMRAPFATNPICPLPVCTNTASSTLTRPRSKRLTAPTLKRTC